MYYTAFFKPERSPYHFNCLNLIWAYLFVPYKRGEMFDVIF